MTIDKQCAEAMARITKHINAAAGQHKRAIGRAHQKALLVVFFGGRIPQQVEAGELNAVDRVVQEHVEVIPGVRRARKLVVKPVGGIWRDLRQSQVDQRTHVVGGFVRDGDDFGNGGGAVQIVHGGFQKYESVAA